MQVGVEINPAAKCLDGCDDPGHKLIASYHPKITDEGAESAAAKISQERAVVFEKSLSAILGYKLHF